MVETNVLAEGMSMGGSRPVETSIEPKYWGKKYEKIVCD